MADIALPGFAEMSDEEKAFFATRGEDTPPGGEGAETPPEPAGDEVPPELPADEPRVEGLEPPARDEDEPLPAAAAGPGTARPKAAPIPALQEERVRRQKAEERMQALENELLQHREYRARIDERLRVFNEQQVQATEAAKRAQDVPPDPTQDPEGYRDYLDRKREERIAQLEATVGELRGAGAASNYTQNVAALTQTFAARTPDYFEATGELRRMLDEEMELAGIPADPAVRQEMVNRWAEPLVRNAMARGMNPGEAIYRIAKHRLASRTPAPKAEGEIAPPTNSSRLEAIRRGKLATRSLSGRGARDVADGLTLDKLLDAEPSEFARYLRDQPNVVAALMGK